MNGLFGKEMQVITAPSALDGSPISLAYPDAGDRMYMIAFGRVVVTQTTLLGATTELVKLGPNKAFGELALIDNSPRKATVTTLTSVGLWSLERVPFCQLFGSIQTAVQESIGNKLFPALQALCLSLL